MKTIKRSKELVVAARQSLREREYWMEKLSGELTQSRFPQDFKPGNTGSPVFETANFVFSDTLFERLVKLSNGSHARLHMILTAGMILLLYKYTRNTDVLVGAPVDRQEISGEFINTVLTLRERVEPAATFKDLLLQVRKTVIEAAENQNYPIEALLYDLGMDAGDNRFPLFDVTVTLENIQEKKYLDHINTGMNFIFSSREDQIEAAVEYNSLLYEKGSAERIFNHLENLLTAVLNDPNRPLAEITMLSEAERNRLLVDFNDTAAAFPEEKTIHGLFEAQAAKTPGNRALAYEGEVLTYDELNRRANDLAWFLKQKGVGPGAYVGICVERSIEMVVGMLAILKAGGAYVPLDPLYPAERIVYMVENSDMKLLLRDEAGARDIPFHGEIVELSRDGEYSGITENPGGDYRGDRCAYMIYTSGSTGEPKGVVIEHASITNTLYWRKNHYGFDPGYVVLQVPSFSFDSSVEDIFTPLISGSMLVLINYGMQLEPGYMEGLIRQYGVNHFLMVPNLYGSCLKVMPGALKDFRSVTVAGDNFTEQLVKEHFETLPGVRLFNEYGPTENSVCATVYEFSPGDRRVLIGKPIDNVTCFIVDDVENRDRPVPIGVRGELCISGAGLARGYWKRNELTEEKFVPNPFLPGEKMYRTGDCARWLPDGNIEFLGRLDHQVKIRGYRIETGEIENQLLTHACVKEAVVVVKTDAGGDKYLGAYLVSEPGADTAEIREYLSDRLPTFMVPANFTLLDRLPLTPGGKIDRKGLAEMEDNNAPRDTDYIAPRSRTEEELARIWETTLKRERVGVDENYFNIGGDSIKCISLINEINETLGTGLKIVDLYVHNTIEKLADKIDRDAGTDHSAEYGEVLGELEALKERVVYGD